MLSVWISTSCGSGEDAGLGAGALLILTQWPEFANVDLNVIGETMLRPLIFDGRNLLEGEQVRAAGFE